MVPNNSTSSSQSLEWKWALECKIPDASCVCIIVFLRKACLTSMYIETNSPGNKQLKLNAIDPLKKRKKCGCFSKFPPFHFKGNQRKSQGSGPLPVTSRGNNPCKWSFAGFFYGHYFSGVVRAPTEPTRFFGWPIYLHHAEEIPSIEGLNIQYCLTRRLGTR